MVEAILEFIRMQHPDDLRYTSRQAAVSHTEQLMKLHPLGSEEALEHDIRFTYKDRVSNPWTYKVLFKVYDNIAILMVYTGSHPPLGLIYAGEVSFGLGANPVITVLRKHIFQEEYVRRAT